MSNPDVETAEHGLDSLREAVRDLPPRLRLQIADRWLEAALDEHASIAAFSRFSLHLMAVGAPPDLIAAAHEAALAPPQSAPPRRPQEYRLAP